MATARASVGSHTRACRPARARALRDCCTGYRAAFAVWTALLIVAIALAIVQPTFAAFANPTKLLLRAAGPTTVGVIAIEPWFTFFDSTGQL